MPRMQYHHEMETFRSFAHHHLLSTVHQYIRYTDLPDLNPLDLSVKTNSTPITPPCTPSPTATCKREKSPISSEPPVKKKPGAFGKNGKKANRKLNFDAEDNSSPVSGTIIRELRPDETLVVRKGDIDPAFNVVEITEEAKVELSKIDNLIGDYVCRLCKELYEDAFGLAQHRCTRIVHVEYRCPECDKVFNCPANLASHRRWHKPRPKEKTEKIETVRVEDEGEQFPCLECGKRFRRVAYLRKHQMVHQGD